MKATPSFLAAVAVSIGFTVSAANGTPDGELKWRPAIALILSAFQTHPVVALSEGTGHGQLATRDFFTALIHDSRFRSTVRNIVIEFGTARYQTVMDRYVNGDPVTVRELRHVWEDTTQVTGVWSLPMYQQMLAEVRSVNAGLSPARRIRIILGDPPIDWSSITSPADEDMNDWRDAHVAHVIAQEAIGRNERVLVLIGGAHISRTVGFPNSLIHLLDLRFPGQTWVIGMLDPQLVDADIRTRIQPGTLPAGVSVRQTWLGHVDARRIGYTLSRGVIEDDVDALIILPASSSRSPQVPVLDDDYRAELTRRRELGNTTLPFRGAKIRFEANVAAFTFGADQPLQAVLRELLRDVGLRLLVKGFSDPTEADAVTLSSRRAQLIIDWLTARGVDRERLVSRGCGAARPLNFGNTASERAVNRRAELVRLTATAGCEPPW